MVAEYDIEHKAKPGVPRGEIREVREEPTEVDDAKYRQREALQHSLGLVPQDRHEREERDAPHGYDHEETEASDVRQRVGGDHRQIHGQNEEPLAIEPCRARELLEAVDREHRDQERPCPNAEPERDKDNGQHHQPRSVGQPARRQPGDAQKQTEQDDAEHCERRVCSKGLRERFDPYLAANAMRGFEYETQKLIAGASLFPACGHFVPSSSRASLQRPVSCRGPPFNSVGAVTCTIWPWTRSAAIYARRPLIETARGIDGGSR